MSINSEEDACYWRPLSFADLFGAMARRDGRAYAAFISWLLLSLVSIESGRIFITRGWANVPVSIGSLSGYITVFPPVFFCSIILFGLGLRWALIPAYLSSFVVNCEGGLSIGWAAMIACGDSLELGLIALAYRSSGIAYDLRSFTSISWFVGVSFLSSLAGSMGGLVWSESHASTAADTVRNWVGWMSGSFTLTLLIMPVLRFGARRWATFRSRLSPGLGNRGASFLFITTSVTGAGLMIAGFLAGSNYVAATRLSVTLGTAVLPVVKDRIWAAVASWQIAAWCATCLIAIITVGTLVLSRFWSQRWNAKNAALSEAVEAANIAGKAKSDFLATMSHELRTPMHGVLGLDELLLATDLNEEQREYALLIERSTRSLLQLLNDLLDFSKIEAGKMELHIEEFDLPRELKLVFQLLQPQALVKGLSFQLGLGDDLPVRTFGDADRVRQILLNLVGNALKFTEKGYVRICVTRASSPPDGSVQFLVQDSGPGIAPGTLDRLFMPFTQGDSSMSRKHGGTGLGLSIARRLVELMNGSIYAKSVIGQGSEFGFTLPLSSAGPVVSAPAQDEPRAASTWAIDESGRRRPA